MAIQITSIKETEEYILKIDRKSKDPTIFVYRRLKDSERKKMAEIVKMTPKQAKKIKEISDLAKSEGRDLTEEESMMLAGLLGDSATTENLLKQSKYAVGCALTKIKGPVYDRDGKKTKIKIQDFMNLKAQAVFFELGKAISDFSDLQEVEIKN